MIRPRGNGLCGANLSRKFRQREKVLGLGGGQFAWFGSGQFAWGTVFCAGCEA
jgi:hypothetical protein